MGMLLRRHRNVTEPAEVKADGQQVEETETTEENSAVPVTEPAEVKAARGRPRKESV